MFKVKLTKNLSYLIGDRNISEFCKRVSAAMNVNLPKSTVQGWLDSPTGNVRALHHLKVVAEYISKERGRHISVDDLLFADLEAQERRTRKPGTTVLDAILGDQTVSGTFQITIRRVPDKD